MPFEQNEGLIDRIIRFVAASLLIVIASFYLVGWLAAVAYVVAGILLITSAIGFCGVYKILNFNTKK